MSLNDTMPASRSNLANVLFGSVMVIHLLPIWMFHYVPTADGPAHVGNAYVLGHYEDPQFPEFRRYYELNPKPVPNYLTHVILMTFMKIASPGVAEKLFLSMYVILLPLAARYALTAVRSDAGFLSLLVFPFTYNFVLHGGFYNFCLGLPLFFFIAGYWQRHQRHFGPTRTVVLALLLLLTYFSHIVPFVAVSLTIATLAVAACWKDVRSSSTWLVAARRYLLPPAVAGAAPVAFALAFVAGRNSRPVFSIGLTDRLLQLATGYSLVSFERWELTCAVAVVAIFAGTGASVLLRRTEAGQGWPFLAAVATGTVVYLIAPNQFGSGTFITERLLLFVYFSVLLWLGTSSFTRGLRQAVQVSAVVVSLLLVAGHSVKYRELNRYIDEYFTLAPAIRPNTTVFTVLFSYNGEAPDGHELAHRIPVFANLSSRIAAERGVVDLRNYEAWTGDFPLMFRSHLDPLVQLSSKRMGIYSTPPAVDLIGYPARTGGTVDYVIVWSTRPDELQNRGQAILDQLNRAFALVTVSTPNGYGRLYRAKSMVAQ